MAELRRFPSEQRAKAKAKARKALESIMVFVKGEGLELSKKELDCVSSDRCPDRCDSDSCPHYRFS